MLLGSLQAACNLDVIEKDLGVSVTVAGGGVMWFPPVIAAVQSTMDDQVVSVHTLVQLLQAVIAFRCCRTISGLTKVLVRLAMTLHTWSRIVMRCISSSRHLRSLQYLD